MSKKLQHAKFFRSNVTAVGGCRFGSRRDIGIITPQEMVNGYEDVIRDELQKWQKLDVHLFHSQEDLFEDIATNKSHRYCFAFELSKVTPSVKEVNVTIYFPRDDLSGLINTYTPLYDLTLKNPDWFAWNKTFLYGTPHFMMHVTDLLLFAMRGRRTKLIELAFIPMKSQAFQELPPTAAAQLTQTFPVFFVCIYLLPLYYLTSRLAEEKESKAREGLKMMGLSDRSYYESVFILNLGLQTYTSLLVILVLQAEVFAESSFLLLLAMCLSYGTQAFGFSLAITSVFGSKKASATAASILHLATFYLVGFYSGYGSSFAQKSVVASLVPNCSLGFMIEHLLHCEVEGGIGLNAETASLPYQSFSFTQGLACQVVCSLLWALLGMYLDKVMPKEFGRSEPWNFMCKIRQESTQKIAVEEQHRPELIKSGNFEAEEFTQATKALRIRGLKKVYQQNVTAVKDVSMTMYPGQIFALLGHNGAGKSSTIGMLTGLLEPTTGAAQIGDLDIFADVDKLRQNLGVCPQHNVLFADLTVREHLELFAQLKSSLNEFELMRKVNRMIYEIELDDVQDQLASTLSGGQKRKLSVGIALIGDAKIVMLDEPTSGMDTTTRRRFWEMIKRYKSDRIIILTTHYMDEADVLGDRICIMAEGEVQCCGSALFLKNRFGVGYRLSLIKSANTCAEDVQRWLKKHMEKAIFVQDLHSEMIYQIPQSESSKFKVFYEQLDTSLHALKLQSYSVSITTLEEVFLKITQTQQKPEFDPELLADYSAADDDKHKSFRKQLITLVWKKLLVQVRDFRSCLMDLLLPCVMIVLGVWASQLEVIPEGHPARNLSLEGFPKQHLITNYNSTFQAAEDQEEYRQFAFADDFQTTTFSKLDTDQQFFEQVKTLDDELFNSPLKPFWVQPFIQEASQDNKTYSLAALVNASQPTAALAAPSYLLQGLLRTELEDPEFKLNFLEAQLPFGMEWQVYINTATSLLSSVGFAIAFMMISDTLIQQVIKERQLAIKHQIYVSGGFAGVYWLSHYLVDVCMHFIPTVVTLQALWWWAFDVPDVEYLFLMFVVANPVFIYALSVGFRNDQQASVAIRVLYFACGGVAPIAMQVLNLFNKETQSIASYLEYYLRFVPVYNLNVGFISTLNRWVIESLQQMEKGSLRTLDWECALGPIYWIGTAGLVSCGFLVLWENQVFSVGLRPMLKPIVDYLMLIDKSLQVKPVRLQYSLEQLARMEDDSLELTAINREKPPVIQRYMSQEDPLQTSASTSSALRIQNLSKSYQPLSKAVDDLSFTLDFGECFALLGITGAGKTTTFKCLCQEETPDAGSLFISDNDVRTFGGFLQARQMIGYCPQFDALFDNLSVWEHLKFYATIKGIDPSVEEKLIRQQIEAFDLLKFRDTVASKLSGGTKRKLSCAIALIGNPPLILLDEPSTGVDPLAKRHMWQVISSISTVRKRSTVVLTTHSMEEAEALCPKMGIMVDGRFQCFGSAEEIKQKYADGFDISLRLDELIKDKRLLDFNREVKDADVAQILKAQQLLPDGFSLDKVLKDLPQPFVMGDLLRWAALECQRERIIKALSNTFGTCEVVSNYANRVLLKVPKRDFSIGFVFGFLESMKSECGIVSYQASQTTLEQIFNMFASQKQRK